VLLALAVRRPWLGLLTWAWFSYMNPHRLCYGFAFDQVPFVAIIAVVTLGAMLMSNEPKRLIWSRETVVLALLVLWMTVTTFFALAPVLAWREWQRVVKIQLMIFVSLMLLTSRERVHALIWTIVLSLGFFGVKGGIFTLVTGGSHRVYGPGLSFIADNNELALALSMTIPLMRYLQLNSSGRWIRRGAGAMMILSGLAALATYSRGGVLALGTVTLLMLLKTRKKLVLAVVILMAIPTLIAFMPQQWSDRMESMQNYEEDASAVGRLNAWRFAINLVKERPIVGGGFKTFVGFVFRQYAPNPWDHHDSHSIYFKFLAEHGIPGLLLFLTLGLFTWRSGAWVIRHSGGHEELKWASDLVAMVQVGLAGYAVGGVFSGLGYFDLPYHYMAIIVICKVLVKRSLAARTSAPVPEPEFASTNIPLPSLQPVR